MDHRLIEQARRRHNLGGLYGLAVRAWVTLGDRPRTLPGLHLVLFPNDPPLGPSYYRLRRVVRYLRNAELVRAIPDTFPPKYTALPIHP